VKTLLLTFVLNAALLTAADEEHWFVQRIESIRVPSIQIDAALPSEALEYLRIKARDWESDRKPEARGFSLIATALNDSMRITYQKQNTTMKAVLQDFATLTASDIHITTVGVFIVPTGEVPPLHIKSSDSRILKTYRTQQPATKPSK
jgi:general secretion pathway protein D